jgi:hypothetical protein
MKLSDLGYGYLLPTSFWVLGRYAGVLGGQSLPYLSVCSYIWIRYQPLSMEKDLVKGIIHTRVGSCPLSSNPPIKVMAGFMEQDGWYSKVSKDIDVRGGRIGSIACIYSRIERIMAHPWSRSHWNFPVENVSSSSYIHYSLFSPNIISNHIDIKGGRGGVASADSPRGITLV